MNNNSISKLVNLALQNIIVIIATMLVFAVSAYAYCLYFVTPKYSATGSVIVTNGSISIFGDSNTTDPVTRSDISDSITLSTTIVDVLKTNDIYKELSEVLEEEYGITYSYGALKGSTYVAKRSNETLFIDVTVTSSSQRDAITTLNKYLELAPDYIAKFIPHSTATVTTKADSAYKTYPNELKTTIFSAVLGALVSYGIVFLIFIFKNTVETEEDFTNTFEDITVLGSIPDFESAKTSKNYKYYRYYKGGRA